MRVIQCVCGARLEGADNDVFGMLRAHIDSSHPDDDISDDKLRETLDAWSGNEPWDGQRRPVAKPVDVKPLSVDTLDDFLAYFDRRAFMDNPFWAGCYCAEPHHMEVNEQSPAENRKQKIELIRAGIANGVLAYLDGGPVGWCNAAPRSTLPQVLHRILAGTDPDPGEHVGSIACFMIAAPWRGSGVGASLLDAACDGFKAQGFTVAEAYPLKGDVSEAESYHGPLPMYEAAGFERDAETDRHIIVRKQL